MAAITAIPTKVGAANPAPGEARMFTDAMRGHNLPALRRAALSELQINLGKLCNQACSHCHVCPIADKCYHCVTCASYHLCHACFCSNQVHLLHPFEFRKV